MSAQELESLMNMLRSGGPELAAPPAQARENFEAMQGFHAGWRKSGIGGADGKHGLYEYMQTHMVYLQFDNTVK